MASITAKHAAGNSLNGNSPLMSLEASRTATKPRLLVKLNTPSAIGAAAFLLGVAVVLVHSPFNLAERGDLAIWDYIAQSVLRGQVPYRDVIEIKSPLSAYLSAAFMAAGKLVGLQDILGARLLQVLLLGSLSTVTYLVAEAYLLSRAAAVIAFLIPLLPEHLATMIAGTQPKLPMILFGMLSLLWIAKDRPVCAGMCSMLSCLCWQPGLVFTGTAFLVFSGCFVRWRDLRAVKVLAGAAVPLAVVALYFYLAGALADLWTWTIAFNLNVYAPREIKGLREALPLIWRITRQVFRSDTVFVVLSAAGIACFIFRLAASRLRGSDQQRWRNISLLSIVLPPLVYLGFCVINFQGGPDLIPLFPFIGIFAGWLFVELRLLMQSNGFERNAFSLNLGRALPCLVLIIICGLLVVRSLAHRSESGPTLDDQIREFQAITKVLETDDKIYVHGTMEILVLLNRPNLNPYIMFDEGKDAYVADRKYGGSFQAILDELGAQAPRIVSLSRLRHVTHGAEFERWVLERYQELPVSGYDDIYVRKQKQETLLKPNHGNGS